MPLRSHKINVMHTVLSLEVGGLEKVVCDMVLGLNKEWFNVEVCCFDTLGELSELLKKNYIYVNLLKRNQDKYDFFFPFRLRKLLREKNVQILHMHSGTFFLGTQAGVLARIPAMIYTDHGRHLVEPKFLVGMDRFSSMFANKVIAVSNQLEEYLVDVVKLPCSKTTTIINGIDTTMYKPRNKSTCLMDEFGIGESTKVIGTVGRLAEVKDQATMIKAFARVNQQFQECILMLVGDGPKKNDLQQLVKDQGLSDKVFFVGSRGDVPNLINLFDIFLLTSLSEGTSISLLEAMSSGVTPIVTDIGGNTSIVDNELNGIKIKPGDVDRLSDSIIGLLTNDDLRYRLGRNAINKVREKYSMSNMIQEYTDLYFNLSG